MPLHDHAREAIAAGLPDGPFRGVPFLMKDLTASIAGVPMTRGSRFFADAPPPAADSEHVARLRRAGLVIFGRTNTCELGLSLTCEPQLHGPTRSPWDLTRISGGSSGGAAAAVGARILPMAQATDGFGSIRVPAACCGLVGLKPTRGRNTMAPWFNLTGQPAMMLPLGWTDDNPPLAVQLVAPHGDEATLFRLAAQLEQARPWLARTPPVV
jgi:Asp-tRNA(Asn)/Glu-tRNA(Gln) amidotransferase A subunit family amidase